MWRGDIDLAALGAPLPAIIGHEMTGTVAKLGEGVTTDSAGQPLAAGDRVVHRYFYPCGRCRACLKGNDGACLIAPLTYISTCEQPPHFLGVYAEYFYLRPNHTVFKVPDDLTDEMVAPANCALSQVIHGLGKVGFGFGKTIVIQGAGGLGIYATAVAKDMGAEKIIVIDGIEERLRLAKAFGADELIDLRQIKTPMERGLKIKELTGGWGADVVAERRLALAGHDRHVAEPSASRRDNTACAQHLAQPIGIDERRDQNIAVGKPIEGIAGSRLSLPDDEGAACGLCRPRDELALRPPCGHDRRCGGLRQAFRIDERQGTGQHGRLCQRRGVRSALRDQSQRARPVARAPRRVRPRGTLSHPLSSRVRRADELRPSGPGRREQDGTGGFGRTGRPVHRERLSAAHFSS